MLSSLLLESLNLLVRRQFIFSFISFLSLNFHIDLVLYVEDNNISIQFFLALMVPSVALAVQTTAFFSCLDFFFLNTMNSLILKLYLWSFSVAELTWIPPGRFCCFCMMSVGSFPDSWGCATSYRDPRKRPSYNFQS